MQWVRFLSVIVAVCVAAACAADDADFLATTTRGTVSTTESVSPTEVPAETPTTPVVTTLVEAPDRTRAAELPLPFTEVAGAVWDDRIVVVGGLDAGGEVSDRTYMYDPETDTWETGPNLPVALHHTALAVLGDRIYVVGGYSNDERGWVPEAGVWSLGLNDESWQPEPALAIARGALAVASTGDRLMAIGGVGPGVEHLTSTEILEPEESAWVPGLDLMEQREHLAATAVGDEVYAIGGRTGELSTNKASVEVLVSEQWEEAPPLNFSRGGIGASVVDEAPCVVGGEEPDATIDTVECLVDGAWQVVAHLEVPRHGLAVVTLDGAIHVVGGGPSPGLATSGVHEIIDLGE